MHAAQPRPPLLRAYSPDPTGYDELLDRAGEVRPHWRYLATALEGLGASALVQRARAVDRALRDHGVTFRLHDEAHASRRPWALDPIPLVMDSADWAAIEDGLRQRAELFNAVLTDLYGPRRLLHQGLIPPEVVFGHAGFLRPCDGVVGPRRALSLYGADLVRAANGQAWVLGDRVGLPEGAGYALENRVVLGRVLPSLFRDAQVHRLAGFFRVLRAGLAALAPHHEAPTIVVLGPGPDDPSHFEQAYLAAYLGFPLVEARDLTVRGGTVWMRSLQGLSQVHVIVRRKRGIECDDLELGATATTGVPGLLAAARAQGVAIANPIGAGVLDNPGLIPFLPGIARHVLGQDLRLPSIATWWCGQRREREFVIAHLDQLVIKAIDREPGARSVFGPLLSRAQLDAWRRQIRAAPHRFVGQEVSGFSTAPCLEDGVIRARPVVLRSFAVAQGDDYAVLAGGLARVRSPARAETISNPVGGLSKDTWVLASEPEDRGLAGVVTTAGPRVASAPRLPSGSGEHLFWLGRRAEQCEALARLVRAVVERLHEHWELGEPATAEALIALRRALPAPAGERTGTVPEMAPPAAGSATEQAVASVLVGGGGDALGAQVRALSEAADAVRDLLSPDMQRTVHWLMLAFEQLSTQWHERGSAGVLDELDRLLTLGMALHGLASEGLGQGEAWALLELGRRLERALHTTRMVRDVLAQPRRPAVEAILADALLRTCDSLVAHRQRRAAQDDLAALLETLVLDTANPRSLAFQAAGVRRHLDGLLPTGGVTRLEPEQRLTIELESSIRLLDPEALAAPAAGVGEREALVEAMSGLERTLLALADGLAARWFTPGDAPQRVGNGGLAPEPG